MADSQENYLKILEKIGDVNEKVGVLTNETQHLKTSIVEVKAEISHIKDQDIHQNKLLDEHIRGVETAHARLDNEILARQQSGQLVTRQIEDIDSRLKRAEKIPDAIHAMRKFLQWLAVVITGLVGLLEYLRHS